MLGLGVAILLLGGISFDLWRRIGERRDVDYVRTHGLTRLDPALVDDQIGAVLTQQPPSVLEGLSPPVVLFDVSGCDVTVRFERTFDFALLDFGRASNIEMSATGCASVSQG